MEFVGMGHHYITHRHSQSPTFLCGVEVSINDIDSGIVRVQNICYDFFSLLYRSAHIGAHQCCSSD